MQNNATVSGYDKQLELFVSVINLGVLKPKNYFKDFLIHIQMFNSLHRQLLTLLFSLLA
jgi:hypothetical protein